MIRLLTGGDIQEVASYLERNYMEAVLFAGNLRRCGIDNDGISRRAGDYYGYFADNRLLGLLAFYNLGNVVVHFEAESASRCFAEIIQQRRFEMLVGLKVMIEPLCLALAPHKSVLSWEESYHFVNYTLKPYSLDASCQVAKVETVDQSRALAFIVEAYRQGFQRRFNQELAVKLIEDRQGGEDFVFLLVDTIPVAQALIQVVAGRTAQIGGVYTNERHRGKGYCKALVGELCQQIHAAGRIPTLMVRKDNIPAVRAYQALGFTCHDEWLLAKFKV